MCSNKKRIFNFVSLASKLFWNLLYLTFNSDHFSDRSSRVAYTHSHIHIAIVDLLPAVQYGNCPYYAYYMTVDVCVIAHFAQLYQIVVFLVFPFHLLTVVSLCRKESVTWTLHVLTDSPLKPPSFLPSVESPLVKYLTYFMASARKC